MLIIAIPKSMSSSLKKYMSMKPGVHSEYRLPPLQKVRGWKFFSHFTNACGNFPKDLVLKLCYDKTTIWKAHIPPTEHNLRVFNGEKKVVLLRKLSGIIASWRRTTLLVKRPLSGLNFPVSYLKKDDKAWVQYAREIGLLDELKRFKQGWNSSPKNTLYITYNQLLRNPKKTVNRVEKFFGLPISNEVALPRIRYTRGEKTQGKNR